jgi:transketolase
MRNTFAEVFYELAKEDKNLIIVVADISPAGAINKFRTEFPDRFVNVGVAEQIMIGMVAGMSLRNLQPFAYTIAAFTLFRPFEFVRNDLCYQNLPVTIVGICGYKELGSTHYVPEDEAIAKLLPNLKIISPQNIQETIEATRFCAKQKERPIYLRLHKL